VDFQDTVEVIGQIVDALGVAVIVLGVLVATGAAVRNLRHRQQAYQPYRRQLGRSILLGLEFLVAANIIRTVAIAPTFTDLGVLALIVLIRTFLSFSLELEITGRRPWQQSNRQDTPNDAAPSATHDIQPPAASS
jgi:uncharacterized membrane protein